MDAQQTAMLNSSSGLNKYSRHKKYKPSPGKVRARAVWWALMMADC
jgi:hypothetical protein